MGRCVPKRHWVDRACMHELTIAVFTCKSSHVHDWASQHLTMEVGGAYETPPLPEILLALPLVV